MATRTASESSVGAEPPSVGQRVAVGASAALVLGGGVLAAWSLWAAVDEISDGNLRILLVGPGWLMLALVMGAAGLSRDLARAARSAQIEQHHLVTAVFAHAGGVIVFAVLAAT